MDITLAVDAMGGDHGLSVTLPATLSILKSYPNVSIVLVGAVDLIQKDLTSIYNTDYQQVQNRLKLYPATQIVGMDESPAIALRSKKDSSMRVAINLVKENQAQACISAGNTGALMAIARFVLKMLPNIERPAIASPFPTQKNQYTYMLDLGANVDCTASQLEQFAIMGSMLVSAIEHKENPTVGLLNVGEEDIKGNELVKQTSILLKESGLNFYGNVEGNDIFKGTVDVVVCDGFVGNISLKTSEGLAQLINSVIKQEFSKNIFTKLIAMIAMPILNGIKKRLDHRRYNGATLLGLKGIVLKSHGSADKFAFEQAIIRGINSVENKLLDRMNEKINQHYYNKSDLIQINTDSETQTP